MQSGSTEDTTSEITQTSPISRPRSQHGSTHRQRADSWRPPPDGDHDVVPESGSEWSLSPSASPSSSVNNDSDAWLSLGGGIVSAIRLDIDSSHTTAIGRKSLAISNNGVVPRKNQFHLNDCPQEILFHAFSHLSASDLLTLKLVSRRFYHLVTSPLAWIHAFSNYFPGEIWASSSQQGSKAEAVFKSSSPVFTRLTSLATWTAEFLSRTKLLRALARGRPAIPFASPSPGKPHKGFATFTFMTSVRYHIDCLHAEFGTVGDKRLPLFIHGMSDDAVATCSDRRGEFHGWGQNDSRRLRRYDDHYPQSAKWGLGDGHFAGGDNLMDVSANIGVLVGEGVPGGRAFYLGHDEKHGRWLQTFVETTSDQGVFPITDLSQSITSVWLAKSQALPRISKGAIGMLVGSSCGVVSAHSLGLHVSGIHYERGQLTARWILSPGVPIVALAVDDNFTAERYAQGRTWAVALNALGEVFYLKHIPQRVELGFDRAADPEYNLETYSWHTARTAPWGTVATSQVMIPPTVLSVYQVGGEHFLRQPTELSDIRKCKVSLSRTPAEIRAAHRDSWDMRLRLEVDFAGSGSGLTDTFENIFVFHCNHAEEDLVAVKRFTRCAMPVNHSHDAAHASFESGSMACEWRMSDLALGRFKHMRITTTMIDKSKYARTTFDEDEDLYRQRLQGREDNVAAGKEHFAPLKVDTIPGQRACFVAAGTSTGSVLLWDARGSRASSSAVIGMVPLVRIIETDSPAISSLALTSLYVVHGGSDGLVQAWDPLGSDEQPIRTIASRHPGFNRIPNNVLLEENPQLRARLLKRYAAGAICLDPEPGILRGIVAYGFSLRYWSYSSSSANDASSKSHRRRLNKANRALKSNQMGSITSTRRMGMKMVVDQELAHRNLDRLEKEAQAKEDKRIAGRFGLDLLGEGASEEELLAYAKLLSAEDQEKRAVADHDRKLSKNASDAELAGYLQTLSPEELDEWKFASWDDRLAMTPLAAAAVKEISPPRWQASPDDLVEDDLARALRESLEAGVQSSFAQNAATSSRLVTAEADVAEAIRLSLEQTGECPPEPSTIQRDQVIEYDDDLAEALRRSLKETHRSMSPEVEEFPALGSPSSKSPPGKSTWKQGKRRA